MRTLHVISSISSKCGGPSRSVQGLVAGLNRAGVDVWLMTLQRGEMPWVEDVLHFINGGAFENAVQSAKPQIVHFHGIWSLSLHRCVSFCRKMGIPYVIAPRGMLEPWSLKQKRLKKKIARWLYQDRDLECAAALHATAESEAEQFVSLGFRNKIIVSPNGVNTPAAKSSEHNAKPGRRVLFVSRMHPKKGVLELVDAWGRVLREDRFKNVSSGKPWKCELVYTVSSGFEKEYEALVRKKVVDSNLEEYFVFTGALSDDKKWEAYARADLFVLPTYSENFGIVVAEALWAGVPVITTKGTPWRELEDAKCGWWIDLGVEPLKNALMFAMSLSDEERCRMGARGRRLVDDKYTWDAVVKPMIKGYENIISGC